jgi:hypothetical protein
MLTRQRLIALTTGVFWVGACSMGCSTQRAPTEAVATTPKCSDLSGKYMIQGEDGQVHISIEQERCDRATIRRETGYLGTITAEKHVLNVDGTVQKTHHGWVARISTRLGRSSMTPLWRYKQEAPLAVPSP